jgi:cell division transport system ATP-binding protein
VANQIVALSNVEIQYGERRVLNNVNFSMEQGEFVYLIGATGSGKSSLLRLIYGDLKPKAGTINVVDLPVHNLSKSQVPQLRRKLGIIFQDFQLLPDRNVGQNIEFALRATGWTDNTAIKNRVAEVLMMVGLSTRTNDMPNVLSGGEQQRAVIARSLVNDPPLIVGDEPTGNLDPEVALMILELLNKINRSGTAVLMATHNYELIRHHPARVIECRDGQLIDHGMNFQVV